MKDYLLDLVNHTHSLGNINFIKIVANKLDTSMAAMAEDNSVIVNGKFKKALTDFDGTFGMPNLDKLSVILGIPEYEENAKITVQKQKRNDVEVLVGLHFENQTGDFKNDYRFMTTEVVNEKLKNLKFKGVKWDVVINPSLSSIQRFKFQVRANSEEPMFEVKTDKKNLVFFLGDVSSHTGNFVFETNVTGTLSKGWKWPVAPVISILSLDGDKEMSFSDQGALLIKVDSGLVDYEYILPAQQR